MKRNLDRKRLLCQKGRIKCDEPRVSLSWTDPEISNGTCTASPCKFGASFIGLKALMGKEQHFIQGQREISYEGEVMICTMSSTRPRCSMPLT